MSVARAVAIGVGLFASAGWADEEERVWDQPAAEKMVKEAITVERSGKRPWNKISWRTDIKKAINDARNRGRPLLVFFYVPMDGPPLEDSCPGGRLMRAHVLSDATVQGLVSKHFIPLKLKLDPQKGFPVDWPALKRWQTAFKMNQGKGFAGCSVVASDLHVEFGNTGSARVWELFDSTAYDAKKFAAMLRLAADRNTEDRSLRAQRGINATERRMVVGRFREGVGKAVKTEGRSHLPPKGYSLEQALKLYELAGVK